MVIYNGKKSMRKIKKLPKFKNLAEEETFWQEKDSIDFIGWDKAMYASQK